MDKLVYVKLAENQINKNGGQYLRIYDQDNQAWNLFNQSPPPQVGKTYLFTFKKNELGYNDIEKITPLVNIFQQKALKEVANRNDFKRDFSIATSYSVQLVTAGKIPIGELFEWADKIYSKFQEKADEEMAKLEEK